jgi:predicted metal-dependent phosphoesterase TrpH
MDLQLRNANGVEAIRAIRAAGGIPVLAHFAAALERIDLVRELVDAGLGGLEAYHASFDDAARAAVDDAARILGLVETGGTDYHGDLGSYAEVHAGLWVPPEVGVRVREALGN